MPLRTRTHGTLNSNECAPSVSQSGAFTIPELLVVIGILALLIAILAPTLVRVRQNANAIKCVSNIRQLGVSMRLYAANNQDAYPMNLISPTARYWDDRITLAPYLRLPISPCDYSSVFWCPADPDAQQSYAMNIWASSAVSKEVLALKTGILWPHQRPSSALILLAESWSYQNDVGLGFVPAHAIGMPGTSAGQRFGALGGVGPINAGRWGLINCELAYARHRMIERNDGFTQPYGRVSIFFDDGHAALCSDADLVHANSGQSSGLAAWSTLDFIRN